MATTYKFYERKNLGIERHNMPQIDSDNLDDFIIHYAGKVKFSKLKMRLTLINPTQNEINEDKLLQMIATEHDWKNRIYIISSDNYLLDGHHDYAIGLEQDEEQEVTVYRVNLKMKDLLKRTKQLKFTTKVDLNGDLIKAEQLSELVKSGCRVVTDMHLEQTLQDVYEEYGFEKAIPNHLTKKIIINKNGHQQTVYVDLTKKDGMKFDFNKHPYKGTNPQFDYKVENAVDSVLSKKGVKISSVMVHPEDSSKVIVQETDFKKPPIILQYYKTKNFASNGIIGIKHEGKIHEKKIDDHEKEIDTEKKYLDKIEQDRKDGEEIAEKIVETTSTSSGTKTEFGGFKVGDSVKYKDGDQEWTGKIKAIKYHEKYDKFGTVLIEDDASGKIVSRSLKKVEKVDTSSADDAEFDEFKKIVLKTSSVSDAFDKVSEIKNVPKDTANKFKEMYSKDGETPMQSFSKFYHEVKTQEQQGKWNKNVGKKYTYMIDGQEMALGTLTSVSSDGMHFGENDFAAVIPFDLSNGLIQVPANKDFDTSKYNYVGHQEEVEQWSFNIGKNYNLIVEGEEILMGKITSVNAEGVHFDGLTVSFSGTDNLVEEPTKSMSEAMKGNQNAKKNGTKEDEKKVKKPAEPEPETWKGIKNLGGSNNAVLVENSKGEQFVTKDLTIDQAKNEFVANKIYESFGLAVPEVQLIDGKLYSKYIPDTVDLGEYLKTASIVDKGKVFKQIKDGFVADALLANWDVIGLNMDNIVVDPKTKKIYRIDNGGSLNYRAQGAKKGDDFKDEVEELQTMADPKKNPNSAKIFKGVTEEQKSEQIKKILDNKGSYLAVAAGLIDAGNSEQAEIGKKMIKRLSHLETLYNVEIKPKAVAEGYFSNGLYKKTGIEEVDKIYEKVDKIMAITSDDKKMFESDSFSYDKSQIKSMNNLYLNSKQNDKTFSGDKTNAWYDRAVKAGATPEEIYYIQMYTGGSYHEFNKALTGLTNTITGNINPNKIMLTGEIFTQMMKTKLKSGDNHAGDNYFAPFLQAAKTINHHQTDKQYNQGTINSFKEAMNSVMVSKADAIKNPSNYSKADINMLKHYDVLAKKISVALLKQNSVDKIEQYKLTETDIKSYNKAIDDEVKKNKPKKADEKQVTFKNSIHEFASESTKQFLVRAKMLTSGLSKLEKSGNFKYKGEIYRKLNEGNLTSTETSAFLEKHSEGDYVFWQRNNSCSKSSTVWSGDYKFTITDHNGVDVEDISGHGSEKEVMLKPFTCIKVNKVVKQSGNVMFSVEQVA